MLRHLAVLLTVFTMAFAVPAPVAAQDAGAPASDRTATGGAQTLDDILRRQQGLPVEPRGDSLLGDDTARDMAGQLGALGGPSDSEVWEALRFGHDSVTVSSGGDYARVLMQDGGMSWLEFRQGPLATYGGYLLLGTLGALFLFYLLRGKVMVDEPMTGRTVTRFKSFERFSHWLLAGSCILLSISGLLVLFGRSLIVPTFGHEVNSYLLIGSKFVHNNLAWPFMLAVILVFFLWVWHNIPNRTDITWFAQFGGIIGKKHPPAKKFNAGQKIIFWSVILLGGSISLSGLSMLFPFQLPMFAKTFTILNDMGVPGLLGMATFPTELAPHEEMQFASLWHSIVAFALMAIVVAHMYIGSIGMQGAYDAMGSGEVDEAWAHQHHALWLEEVKAKQKAEGGSAPGGATPAE